MRNVVKKVLSFMISMALCFMLISVAAPVKEAEAASNYIKVDEYIKYVAQKLKLTIDSSSKTPYIDAAMTAGILKEGDFTSYSDDLTRTDCAVIANRVDKLKNGIHGDCADEVYEFLKDCKYFDGKLYYDTKGELYPEGMDDVIYPASQFAKEVAEPLLSKYYTFNKSLRGKYKTIYDSQGEMRLGQYVEIGYTNNTFSNVDPFDDNNLVQTWQVLVDEERKVEAVYDKRISDLNKIVKSKRRDVAEVVAKGIIKGYSNGMYVQNRSFKGSEKITVSGAKNVIKLSLDKNSRAHISPDGQLIRTTNLPKNASEYAYILECFPNDFYEMVFSFQREKPYKDGTLEKNDYHYPSEVGNDYVLESLKNYLIIEQDTYEYYDTIMKQVELYFNSVLNVDYRTVNQKWVENVVSSYVSSVKNSMYGYADRYLKTMKANHVVIESKIISVEPSTLYEYEGHYYVRTYARYRVMATNLKVKFDYELIFGNKFGTYLVGLKNGKWTYGYYDICLAASNLDHPSYLDFGLASYTGLTDGALKGAK